MGGRPFAKLYSVYDRKTGLPLVICGTSEEVAKDLGIKRNSFYIAIRREKLGLCQPTKYEIFEDEPMTEEELAYV